MQKLDLHITVEGVKEILQEADRNLDGRLDFNEFVQFSGALVSSEHAECSISKVKSSKCCSNEQKVIKNASGGCDSDDPELREAFDVFDKDRSGLISAEELRSTLSGLGLLSSSTSFSRIHSMIRKVDTDGDGEVSFKEFQNMMKESRTV
ncbi:hypothetical protein KP509_11G089800 [Ceratopteris richardii]|nr:hypothetical protein KP509_11G089800 [Ceratopteris richardii]